MSKLQNLEKEKGYLLHRIGVNIVRRILVEIGYDDVDYELSYASPIDLYVGGAVAKVKVLTPYVKYDSWYISDPDSILYGCEYLYIISLPTIKPHYTDSKIFEIDVQKNLSSENIKKDLKLNKLRLEIPRSAEYIKYISFLPSEDLQNLNQHTFSKYRAI